MWIVALALRRPYTFTVFAILILIAGLVAINRTAKDIFPSINIPVVSVIWGYAGMSPEGMGGSAAKAVAEIVVLNATSSNSKEFPPLIATTQSNALPPVALMFT